MALHNLKIIVVDGGKANEYRTNSSGASDAEQKNIKDSPLYKLINAKETITNKVTSGTSPSKAFAITMGINIASQFVKQTANFYISDIGRKNGDSNYQSIINRQLEIVSDAVGLVSGTASGAMTGSMFGPVGTAIGAVLGAVSSGISLGFKYAERERAYQHEIFKLNNNQTYNLARTSFQGFTGRLR